MIITCEQCETSFNLDEGLLKPAGSKVRCSKCKHIFVGYPPGPAEKGEDAAAGLIETDIAGEGVEDLSAETSGAAEEEEIDLSDLDKELKASEEPIETAAAESEEELDLSGLDEGLELADETAEAEAGEPAEEELDLSDLEKELDLGDEAPEAATDEPTEEDLSLDFDLDVEGEEPVSAEAAEEELDLSGLDEALAPADVEAEAATDEPAEEDLSLDFDLDVEGEEPASAEAAEEELDLSGLDEALAPADGAAEAATGEPAEEDLSLDFDLDVEGEEPVSAEAAEEEELDLSDIESMLEEEAPVKAPKKPVEDSAGSEVETEEIDLSELEKMLDVEEESEPAAEAAEEHEDMELDLDIDIEPEPETGAQTSGKETALETEDLDLTDLETKLELDETPAAGVQADLSEDLELEFITEEPQEEELQPDEVPEEQFSDGATEELLMTVEDEPAVGKEKADEAVDSEQAAEEKVVEKRRKKAGSFKPKKRVSPLLVALLVILLLVGGVVALPNFGIQVPYVGDFIKNIPIGDYLRNIPYVGDLLGSKVDERGNLKMTTSDIDSKFVENEKSGRLFVISGKVRNGYDHPRGFIKVTGRLYAKGKKLSKVQTVFCGNALTDEEVSNLDMEAVRKKLLERTGQKQSNVRVPPGMHIPFMLVFSNLPPDLEEFDIQIEESIPAS
ncbi:MAG: zinc-ribbon domain-containing protein [Desulfobacterales bacterium]|nr:zinc-ribbon domain-containing protein [Desulfobacterales bacterium]